MPLAAILAAVVTLAVQPSDGALTLSLDGKPVVTGVLAQEPLKVGTTTVQQKGPAQYQVDVAYTDRSTAVYSYALASNDCTLNYSLTNHGDKPRTLELSGLTCTFAPGVTLEGTIPSWHWTYLTDLAVWHPGFLSPLGIVYATDGQRAVACYSPSEFGRQSVINASWRLGSAIPSPFGLEFRTRRVVAPGGTDSASLVLRVTADVSQDGMQSGYKAFLAGKYPPDQRVSDPRPAAEFASVDNSWVTPANPHGYNGDSRRLDRPDGIAKFLHMVADPLQAGHGQGCIFWAPGGVDSIMYPPDFDDNLARIASTWPSLVEGFRARQLRVGLCARAGDSVDRANPAQPVVKRIDPADPQQVEALLARFRRVAAMGVNAYYLDTFGNDWPTTQLLPLIRATVGPDVPIYTEYCSDATLPFADRYCEYNGGDGVAWTSGPQLQALRYLFPRSVWLCMSRVKEPLPAAFARLNLTPLIQDYLVGDTLRAAAGAPK